MARRSRKAPTPAYASAIQAVLLNSWQPTGIKRIRMTAVPDLVQSEMGHACEWETSMMLRLAPQLVRDHTRAASVPFGFGFEPAYRGWVTKDRTVPGHIGHP